MLPVERYGEIQLTFHLDDGRVQKRGLRAPWEPYQFRHALLDWFEERGIKINDELRWMHPDDLTERALRIQPMLKLRLKKSTVVVRDFGGI